MYPSGASGLGIYCLHMSHKNKWAKQLCFLGLKLQCPIKGKCYLSQVLIYQHDILNVQQIARIDAVHLCDL